MCLLNFPGSEKGTNVNISLCEKKSHGNFFSYAYPEKGRLRVGPMLKLTLTSIFTLSEKERKREKRSTRAVHDDAPTVLVRSSPPKK